jgi:hypothetical protein
VVAVAVRGDVEHQHVLVAFIARPTPLERARKVGDARDRQLLQRVVAARERDRAPGGAEALVEQALHVAQLAQEHLLARVGGEAHEVLLAHARAARLDARRASAR